MTVQPDPMFARRPKSPTGALPYGDTAGHVDVDTSRERAEREADNGTAERRRLGVLALLENSGSVGMTWKEISVATGEHHGQVSGTLSGLHKDGLIAALKLDRRNGCGVYVMPNHVLSRIVRPFRPNNSGTSSTPAPTPAPRPRLSDEERAKMSEIKAALPRFTDKPSVPIRPATMALLIEALERLDK